MRYQGWENQGHATGIVEDDLGCLIEQEDKEGSVRYVKDTDTDQILPMD